MDGWTAIVMAAGRGARMRTSKPKVLHRVAGMPLVSYATKAASRIQPGSTMVVVAPEAREAIAGDLGDDPEYVEQPEPLGTGHALAMALERVPFSTRHILLLNGDMPFVSGETALDLATLHVKRHAAVSVLSAELPAAAARDLGRLQRGARGKPVAIIEAVGAKPSRAQTIEVSVGAYAFDAEWLRGAITTLSPHDSGEIYVTDLVGIAVAGGRRAEVLTVPWGDEPIGVNTRGQLAQAEQAMQRRLRDDAMASGVTLIDPATVYLDATVSFEQDVIVLPNTSIRGATHVASGASIGPNAQVTDSTIGPGVTIESSVVRSAVFESGVHIGPFSHIREGTHLGPDVHIGSHAEIKASHIGKGTHIGHFSYVGDAVIGEAVNIGAGTVTCNYDGVSKHITEIGDGAFIGSDSMLVAPLKIGAGAITGAGAVVTRDVDPGGKVVGVPAKNLESRRRLNTAVGSEGGRTLG